MFLRPGGGGGFFAYNSVLGTLLHELVHNDIGAGRNPPLATENLPRTLMDAIACNLLFMLTCAVLMTSSQSKAHNASFYKMLDQLWEEVRTATPRHRDTATQHCLLRACARVCVCVCVFVCRLLLCLAMLLLLTRVTARCAALQCTVLGGELDGQGHHRQSERCR